MNHSDLLAATALQSGHNMRINDREVCRSPDGSVSMNLHGKKCITRNADSTSIEIDGATRPTRKSTRLLNAVLSCYGTYRVLTRKGQWYLRDTEGALLPFTDKIVTIPVAV